MASVVVNGLLTGLIYGLIGVGLVVLYRGSRVINFAFGETGMIAAFVYTEIRVGSDLLASTTVAGLLPALPVALGVAALLGALTERLAVRPLRSSDRIRPLVATLAVATLFLTFAVRRWGINSRPFEPLVADRAFHLGSFMVTAPQLLIAFMALVIVAVLWALHQFTGFGLRMRAVAIDPVAAGLVGIDVNRTSTLVWALGGLLSGLAAILISPLVTFNVFFMTGLLVRGLAAAVVGGLTSAPGALVAGIVIGLIESIIGYGSPVTGVTDAAVAVFLLGFVATRPHGLVRTAA